MNFSFLTSLFKKNRPALKHIDSIITKNLKEVCSNNRLFVYENITIYHHAQSFYIPLLILDTTRGIYIFEHKPWSYDELKNATLCKAENQDSSTKSVAFDKTHDFIRQKFNELTHNDGVPLFNFLLMENLNAGEYEHLNISFQELLPKNRVIFNDSSEQEIIEKLKSVIAPTSTLPDVANIMGNLLVQYLVLSKNEKIYLATPEQINFINSQIESCQILQAKAGSGKTTSLLLKAILENLRNPDISLMIIVPTTIASHILKQRLLSTIEYAIIEVDIPSIEIITPIELLNRHLRKLKKTQLEDSIFVDKALMSSNFKSADLIMCDDADLLPDSFMEYLKHIQSKSDLLLVSNKNSADAHYHFEKSFRQEKQKVIFKQANPHAKTLQTISKLLDNNSANEILVISNSLSKEKLNDDLEFFIRDKAILLDSSKSLIDQDINNLLLCSYEELGSINAKFVILLDLASASKEQLEYAASLCEDCCYVIYDEACENIEYLRSKYEDKQDTTGVEEATDS